MKRVKAAFALIGGIILYSVIASLFLMNWQGEIDVLIDEIRVCNENGDSGKASAAADELTYRWAMLEKGMSIFVCDEKLNSISSSVAKVPQFVTEANDELDAELESIRRQLKLICRGELPLWYNLL